MNKIQGIERRELKKKIARLKSFITHFWYFRDIDRIYGLDLSDEQCEKILQKTETDYENLKNLLNETI